jgi:hypothetical protein
MSEENNEVLKQIAASLQSIDERLAILISQTNERGDLKMWIEHEGSATGNFEHFMDELGETQAMLRNSKSSVDRESADRVGQMHEQQRLTEQAFLKVWGEAKSEWDGRITQRTLRDLLDRLIQLGWDSNPTRSKTKLQRILPERLDDGEFFSFQDSESLRGVLEFKKGIRRPIDVTLDLETAVVLAEILYKHV